MQRGIKAVKAQFADAREALNRRQAIHDPPAEQQRDGLYAGQWEGAPFERMPPGCPVVPLGVDGKVFYLVDTLGQMQAIPTAEWNKKTVMALFSQTPNYPYFCWPRFGAPKKDGTPKINGLEVDDVTACLMKACGDQGLFDPGDKVRGRGGWVDERGQFIWHSGESLYMVEGREDKTTVVVSDPGRIDGVFYARRPPVTTPWATPLSEADSPGHDLLAAIQSWSWERPVLDPLLALGWIAASYLGGALPWRPILFVTGDRGHGKSTLQNLVKDLLGPVLHASADTTAAGIYQRVKQDSLPVAVDELEADADNRKVIAVIKLARLAASGAEMFRGGQGHEGVTFRARNAFFFSSINPPPLEPADRSRMAQLNLRPVVRKPGAALFKPENPQALGRQLLRRLMDVWPQFDGLYERWRQALAGAGLNDRGCDTYGTLLTCAQMLLGETALEQAGLPITEPQALGTLIAAATADERAEQSDNWKGCLERLLSWTIDNFKGGERPIVGHVMEQAEIGIAHDGLSFKEAQSRLMQCGLGLRQPDAGRSEMQLAVPPRGTQVEKIFDGTKWQGGVWMHALKQGPAHIILRNEGNGQVVRIAGMAQRCLLVSMKEFHKHNKEG